MPRHRREVDIRLDLKEIGVNMKNCENLAPNRDYWRALVNATLNLWVPQAMGLVS